MYEIRFHRKAAEFIRSLSKSQRNKVKTVLQAMKSNPFSYPYRKIRGEINLYRIRFGTYRMLYEISEKQKKIVVLKFEKRSKAYNK